MAKSIKSKSNSNGGIRQNIGLGFGLGIGVALSHIIFIFLGLLFFIPGLYLLKTEQKKPNKERNQQTVIIAYVLMILGVVVGLGMGAGFLFSELSSSFGE